MGHGKVAPLLNTANFCKHARREQIRRRGSERGNNLATIVVSTIQCEDDHNNYYYRIDSWIQSRTFQSCRLTVVRLGCFSHWSSAFLPSSSTIQTSTMATYYNPSGLPYVDGGHGHIGDNNGSNGFFQSTSSPHQTQPNFWDPNAIMGVAKVAGAIAGNGQSILDIAPSMIANPPSVDGWFASITAPLKPYFAVDNRYVGKKLAKVLVPYLSSNWERLVSRCLP